MNQNEKIKQAKYALTARMMLLAAGLFMIFNAVSSNLQYGMTYLNLAKLVIEDTKAEGTQEEAAEEAQEEAAKEERQEEAAKAEGAQEEAAKAEEAQEESAKAEGAQEEAAKADTQEEAAKAEGTQEEAAEEAQEEAAKAEDTKAEPAGEESAQQSQEIDIAALKADMERFGITVDDFRVVGIAFLVMAVIRALAGIFFVVFSNRVNKASVTLKVIIGLSAAEAAFAILLYMKKSLSLGSILYTALTLGVLFWGVLKLRKLGKEDPGRIYAVQPGPRMTKPQQAPAPKKSIRDRAMMNTDFESTAVPEENPTAVPEEDPTAVPEEDPTAAPEEDPSAAPEE